MGLLPGQAPGGRGSRRPRLALAAALALGALLACSRHPPDRDSVTVLLAADIASLDPNQDVEAITDSVLFNVYEPLVALDENLKIQPVLAESWEHPSPERWRFHLRRNARFHDGTPLTSEAVRDVILGLQRTEGHEAAYFLGQIVDVVASAPGTVDIVTREPRAILAHLPYIYVWKANREGAFPPRLGTGPYEIEEWTARERVVLERAATHWGPPPPVRRAVFRPVPDPERRLALLASGEADLAYSVPPDRLDRPLPGVRIVRRTGLTVHYLVPDLRPRPGNPFREVRVRKAVSLALDREAMVRDLLHGAGAVAGQPVAPLVFGYDPGLPPPRHDPAQARRLLAEAGLAGGFRTRLHYSSRRQALAERIRGDLARAGIVLELVPVSPEEIYDVAATGTTELFLAGWDCSTGEASEFYEFALHTPGRVYGGGNYGAWSNPEVDTIAETNGAVLDPRKRLEMLQRASRVVVEELPVIPVLIEDDVYGAREGVRFVPRTDNEIRLAEVSFEPR